MSAFDSFDRAMGRIYHQVGNIVGIAIGCFAIAISVDLLLRLANIGNLPGMQEIVEYLLFACVFLAAPWALRLGAHIRVDVIVSSVPAAVARVMELVLDILGLMICAALAYYGWKNLVQAYQFDSIQRKYFNVHEWWLLSVFVTSFVLLAVEFVSRMIRKGPVPGADHDAEGGM